MSETRRGCVILTQRGDPEIAGAIAAGILAARSRSVQPLTAEQRRIVEAEIDRQKVQRYLLRVAVGNDKTEADYDILITKASGDYARYDSSPGALRRLGRRLLGLYGLLVYGVSRAYRSQNIVLGRRSA